MSSTWRMIFASIGLHTLFLGLWGVLPLGSKADPEDRHAISVTLVEQALPDLKDPSEQAETPPPSPALRSGETPPAMLPDTVSPTPASRLAQTGMHNPAPAEVRLRSDAEPSAKLPESVSFVELPRIFVTERRPGAEVASGIPAALDIATIIYEADLRAEAPKVLRPLLGVVAEGRYLRDTTPETSHQSRSKVKLDGNAGPDYPRSAREAGWEGTVMLRVEVLPNGSAGRVTLRKSSGHSVLDEAALTAVQQWRFVPAVDGHFPVRSLVDLPIRFDLRDSIP